MHWKADSQLNQIHRLSLAALRKLRAINTAVLIVMVLDYSVTITNLLLQQAQLAQWPQVDPTIQSSQVHRMLL